MKLIVCIVSGVDNGWELGEGLTFLADKHVWLTFSLKYEPQYPPSISIIPPVENLSYMIPGIDTKGQGCSLDFQQVGLC